MEMTNAIQPTSSTSMQEIIRVLNDGGFQIDNEQRDQLNLILTECGHDKNRLISIMIGSYCQPNISTPTVISFSREAAGIILFRYINNIDLDTNNVIQMASIIIPQLHKGDTMNIDEISDILLKNGICGRSFVKGTTEYVNAAKFAKLFKTLSNWKDTASVYRKFWVQMKQWELPDVRNEYKENKKHKVRSDSDSVDPQIHQTVKLMNVANEMEIDDAPSRGDCKVPYSACKPCIRTKNFLVEYQSIISQNDDEPGPIWSKMIEAIFDDENTSIHLLDDFHHLVYAHCIDDNASEFESCLEFMVNSGPEISCDVSKCSAVRVHFRRRGERLVESENGNDDIPYDHRVNIMCQIHSFLVHSLDTTKLTKNELIEIEEEMKRRDEQHEEGQHSFELKLISEKMQQKSLLLEKVMMSPKSKKFLTESNFVEKEVSKQDMSEFEAVTSLDEDDLKSPGARRYSMGQRDDAQILQEFRNVTSSDTAIAMAFLKNAEWDLQTAIHRFYEFPGDPTQLGSFLEEKESVSHDDEVYTEGVRFWYWRRDESMPSSAVPVDRRHETLKDEILRSGYITMATWTRFEKECKALLDAKFVRQMSANGIDEDVYEIRGGEPLALKFIIALKLYTDFDALNHSFCEHFRLQKLAGHQFESLQSLVIRNGRFWNFAKLLVECVQCFGRLLVRKNTKYYRGISKEIILKRFVARFHIPLSTSKSVC